MLLQVTQAVSGPYQRLCAEGPCLSAYVLPPGAASVRV